MARADEMVAYLEDLLRHREIPDRYCPSGLQVEGVAEVRSVGFAVDACMESFRQLEDCQMILVHHGLFWPSVGRVTGSIRERLAFLLSRGIGLFASHLPLDKHPNLGNNAQILKRLGLEAREEFGEVGWLGEFDRALPRDEVQGRIARVLGGPVRLLAFGPVEVLRLGVSSGMGSFDLLGAAASRGADLILTGEASHPMYHAAREAGANVALGGHYATETWGLKALMPLLEDTFGVTTRFVDIPTGF
ncbi:MAG: Nif3-like dinuclear metal center hexameric protein [Candidatus Eremiobacterota bacterium]